MEYDWTASRPAFIDFETQSEAELVTVSKYCAHPSTRAVCCVVRIDGVNHRFLQPDFDYERLARITEDRTLVAHNAPFDEAIWTRVCKLPRRKWYDTLPPARAAGLPGRLDDLGRVLTGKGKDKKGAMLIDLLCKVRGGKPVPFSNPAYGLLLLYCIRDVELLEEIFQHVHGFGVPDVMTVDRRMNERGIPIDRKHLERLAELYKQNKDQKETEFDEATCGINPNSPKQVVEWMERNGFVPPKLSVSKENVRELLNHPEKYYFGDNLDGGLQSLIEMLDLRREVARVGFGKVEAALEMLEADGRIRDCLVVYGAGPGRWASRGPQFHNMPNMMYETDFHNIEYTLEHIGKMAVEATAAAKKRGAPPVNNADILSALIRHMVRCDNMLVADYSAVELRGAMYFADEQRGLRIFADPSKSIYVDMGEQLFGRRVSKKDDPNEYTLSKTLVLGCIYGMSGRKFRLALKNSTHSFGNITIDEDYAVQTFRKTYALIPQLWKDIHAAMHLVASGQSASEQVGYVQYHRVGDDMHCVLPSGRPIVYRNIRVEPLVPGYCKLFGMPEEPVDTVTYTNWRGFRAALWGSKQTENVVQGSCADITANATVRAEAEGLHPIFSVHDELACEDGEDRFDDFMRVMSTPPSWCPDFPLLAEGYSGPVWTKQTKPFKNSDWQSGRKLK